VARHDLDARSYLSLNTGRQMCATPAWIVTLGASRQLTSKSQPWNDELAAGRASSRMRVPVGKNALPQRPVVPVRVKVQSIPAGEDTTRPSPFPPRASDRLPLSASNCDVTVIVAPRRAPPASAMIVDDWALATGLVSTGNVARVDPAATVTLGGTVAALVLSLVRNTVCPP
jgi:hypothetical protein